MISSLMAYDEITDACSSIERIADDFASASSSFKRTIESSRQEYISVLQNINLGDVQVVYLEDSYVSVIL